MEASNQLDVFTKLPLELKLEICEYLCDHCTKAISLRSESKPDYGPLASLCLTSRSLKVAAQQVLYHFFWCRDGDPGYRLVPFSTTLSRRPELTAHVRRIRYQPVPWDDPPLDSESDDTSDEDPLRDEIFSLHRALFDGVLSRAENLEELTIQIEKGWRLPPIDFPCLRHLDLGRFRRNITYDNGPRSYYSQDNRGLRAAPRLEQLRLDHWNILEVALPSILGLASNTHLLTTAPERQGLKEISDADQVALVAGVSKLTTFEFIQNFEVQRGIYKILPFLLNQKDYLTNISIQSWDFQIDLALLGEFTNLKRLQLYTWTRGIASTAGEPSSYPSVLPRSLESLQLCFWGSSHQEGITIWLSQNLPEYKHLKYVRTADFEGGRLSDRFREQGVYENFVEAGVEFVTVAWRTPETFNGLWDSV